VIPLPIDEVIPAIVGALKDASSLVLEAPPGAGKTTRVPRAMLDAGFAEGGEIVVLEPRRLAARMAARRVAEELGEDVGRRVGYQVRFEDVSSAATRIRFVTEGILTRRLLSDPTLRGVAAVVLDEFHERHLHGDVALALLRRLQKTTRAELRVIAMSATLDAKPVATFLECASIRAEGRAYEVSIEHLATQDDRKLELQVASAVRTAIRDSADGDVLVFLPGASEIRRAMTSCEAIARDANLLLVPLHGDLSPQEQDRAIKRADRRKVILATNVAESSVTIDGVVAVIDSGLARVASFSPWSGLPSLVVAKISRASAAQRAGRAGRTRAGRCMRLYTKSDHDTRADHDVPEIRRADFAQTLLELRAAGITDADAIAWFDAPPASSLRAAEDLLLRLGATDNEQRVTSIGRAMLRFPLHPRQARLLVEAEARGVAEDGAVVAALLGERDIRNESRARFGNASRGGDSATEDSDLIAMLDRYREAEGSGFSQHAMRAIDLDGGATHAVSRASKQLARLCKNAKPANLDAPAIDRALRLCALAGYPDRVAKRKKQGSRDLALARGGIAELSEASVVRDAEWLIAVDAEARASSKPNVRIASAIEPEWLIDLFSSSIEESNEVTWNAQSERVVAVSRMRYEGLTIDESIVKSPAGEDVSNVLFNAAIAKAPRAFAPEGELDRWLARARFAASVDARVFAPSDEDVARELRAACEGCASFEDLRRASFFDRVKLLARDAEMNGHANAARIEALAPERIPLASGRGARIAYEDGKPPWIESYLQDFFGWKATPKIGDGRAPLVLHLLAPNKRAVQVTTDLAGFWERHYPAIRKELSRKYPRHAWPEDTSVAVAMKVRR
jgi:ATP-dependent helicase HrpB